MERVVIFGNSGSGKSTMARQLAQELGVPHLDLDSVAWDSPGARRSLDASIGDINSFVAAHPGWVAEGSYGDLIEALIPYCTELRFLNPGVQACVANCRARPWEPEKYPSPADQDAMLHFLLDWVRAYETRTDEFSLRRHSAIFQAFPGRKREYSGSRN